MAEKAGDEQARARREQPVKAGRASGDARRCKKRRGLNDAIRDAVARDPDAVAATLLSTGASALGAIKAAGIVDGNARAAEDSPYRHEDTRGVRAGGTMIVDVLRVLWESNPELLERSLVEAGVLEPEPDEEGS